MYIKKCFGKRKTRNDYIIQSQSNRNEFKIRFFWNCAKIAHDAKKIYSDQKEKLKAFGLKLNAMNSRMVIRFICYFICRTILATICCCCFCSIYPFVECKHFSFLFSSSPCVYLYIIHVINYSRKEHCAYNNNIFFCGMILRTPIFGHLAFQST